MPGRRNSRKPPSAGTSITVTTNHGVVAGVIHGAVTVHTPPAHRFASASGSTSDGSPPPPTAPTDLALEHLLCSLFDRDELVRFVSAACPSDDLAAELPPSSLATTVHAAITALRRRGRIDASLFAALVQARPGRQRDINAVAHRYT